MNDNVDASGSDAKPDASKSTIKIESFSYKNADPQLWFTTENTHDKGANMDSAWYYNPFYTMIYGYAKNKMVNRDNVVQNERGVKYVRIDARNYK